MDELLTAEKLPLLAPLEGSWGPETTGGLAMGWQARLTPFEMLPGSGPGSPFLERIELDIWWLDAGKRRTFSLEGFRRAVLTQQDMAAGVGP